MHFLLTLPIWGSCDIIAIGTDHPSRVPQTYTEAQVHYPGHLGTNTRMPCSTSAPLIFTNFSTRNTIEFYSLWYDIVHIKIQWPILVSKTRRGKKNVIINHELGKSPLRNNEGELFWKQLDSILVFLCFSIKGAFPLEPGGGGEFHPGLWAFLSCTANAQRWRVYSGSSTQLFHVDIALIPV